MHTLLTDDDAEFVADEFISCIKEKMRLEMIVVIKYFYVDSRGSHRLKSFNGESTGTEGLNRYNIPSIGIRT
jgi:hypothetical protein